MQSIDGAKRCPMCAFEVAPDAAACGQCGLTLVGLQQVSLGALNLSASPSVGPAKAEENILDIDAMIDSSPKEKVSTAESKPAVPAPDPPSCPKPASEPQTKSARPAASEKVQEKGFMAWLRRLFNR